MILDANSPTDWTSTTTTTNIDYGTGVSWTVVGHVVVIMGDVTGGPIPYVPLADVALDPAPLLPRAPRRRPPPIIEPVRREAAPCARWQGTRPERRLLARGGRPARHSSWYGPRLRGER